MSAPEHVQESDPIGSRSSVQIHCNSKGEPQVSVKVYIGDSEGDLRQAKLLALTIYREAMEAVGR